MYLVIPEQVLVSRMISAEEKILISYLIVLQKAGKKMFAKPEYIENLLGLKNVSFILESLGERNYIVSSIDGKELSPWVVRSLGNTLNN